MFFIKSFENLFIWQNSIKIAINTYKLLANCNDFGLRNQIQRASVSISSNIAEGSERGSDKEFIRFLRISKGSIAELRTQLTIAIEVKLINTLEAKELLNDCIKTSKMIQNFIAVRAKNVLKV